MPPIFQSLPIWFQLTLVAIPALSAIFAASALALNILQSRRTNSQARATLVAGSLKDFANDKDIQRAFYSIEYDKFTYSESFHDSEEERDIDKLLRNFANLAILWKSGLLSIEDLRPAQYYILRVMKNPDILKYMDFMENFLKRSTNGQHPYAVLGELCDILAVGSQSNPASW
jgi:hypothetical protein